MLRAWLGLCAKLVSFVSERNFAYLQYITVPRCSYVEIPYEEGGKTKYVIPRRQGKQMETWSNSIKQMNKIEQIIGRFGAPGPWSFGIYLEAPSTASKPSRVPRTRSTVQLARLERCKFVWKAPVDHDFLGEAPVPEWTQVGLRPSTTSTSPLSGMKLNATCRGKMLLLASSREWTRQGRAWMASQSLMRKRSLAPKLESIQNRNLIYLSIFLYLSF